MMQALAESIPCGTRGLAPASLLKTDHFPFAFWPKHLLQTLGEIVEKAYQSSQSNM